jgi:hypothetical protein
MPLTMRPTGLGHGGGELEAVEGHKVRHGAKGRKWLSKKYNPRSG